MTRDTPNSRHSAGAVRCMEWQLHWPADLLTVAIAAAIFLAFRPRGDRPVSFSQVFAVTAYASVILAMRQLVSVPVSMCERRRVVRPPGCGSRRSMRPRSADRRRCARHLRDLWVILLAMGVGMLHERQGRTLAAAFLGVYASVALLLAATMTALGGTVMVDTTTAQPSAQPGLLAGCSACSPRRERPSPRSLPARIGLVSWRSRLRLPRRVNT